MKRKKLTRRMKERSGLQKRAGNYERKRKYLDKHGGMGIDYPDKPWK